MALTEILWDFHVVCLRTPRYVGELLGVRPAVVRARRLLLGIQPAEPRKALDGYDTVLGLLTDEAVGKLAGVSKQAVTARRNALGIESRRDRRRRIASQVGVLSPISPVG